MWRFGIALAFILPGAAAPAQERAAVPQISLNEAAADPQKRAQLLDVLFKRLKASPAEDDAARVDAAIQALFGQTGSAACNLFLKWAEESEAPQALDYLDGAVMLAPNAPEPYYRRAALHYARQDYAKALADLQRAYILEPRHTGVLLGLAAIFSILDRDREALRAYDEALAVNSWLGDARRLADELRKKVDGEGI